MNSNKSGSSSGVGFCGLLTIGFVILKLLGVIDWPWIWVISPAWISALISLLFLGVVVLVAFIKNIR